VPQPIDPVGLIFSLTPDANLEDATRILERFGINVSERLGELGMILGHGERSQIEMLRQLPQFSSVEEDSAVDIGPPDSPIS
jgi:hypothetical protein